MAKVGSSANFWVVVFKSSLLWYFGGSLAKVGSSANFCVVVLKSPLLWYLGKGPLAKIRFVCQLLVYWYLQSPLLWNLGRWVHWPK